jgi:predicted aspartyl protease
VKEALAALSKPSLPKMTLGPSRTTWQRQVPGEGRRGILTETIQLRSDNGVFWVDVTLNGKVTIPMVFDTGAGIVSLGEEDAAKAGSCRARATGPSPCRSPTGRLTRPG